MTDPDTPSGQASASSPPASPQPPPLWILSEGLAGTENQCLAISDALDLPAHLQRLRIRAPWRWLPAAAMPACLAAGRTTFDKAAPALFGPSSTPPQVILAAGRKTAPLALALKRRFAGTPGGPPLTVFLQRPPLPLSRFDLVVAPAHDRLEGANVISTLGALTRVTGPRLAEAAGRFAPRFQDLPRPLVAVLIGGANRHCRITPATMADFAARLEAMARTHGAGLLLTASRRSDEALLAPLLHHLSTLPAFFWRPTADNAADNPYLGFLALADALIVTGDSVSMASDAAATGKPLFIAHFPRAPLASDKLGRFHRALEAAGIARPFDGTLAWWTYPPLREAQTVAAAIEHALEARRPAA